MDNFERLSSLLRGNRRRQGLLFVGAGFSAEAKGRDLHGDLQKLPSARDLAKYMAKQLGEDDADLMALSSLYEDSYGEHGLYSLLKSFFVVSETTETQKIISRFPWKQIYTTQIMTTL